MKRNKKGQVLVLVALAIFALMGLTALGIDVGYMYSVRHELQRCADAGALAGASAFRDDGRNCDDPETQSKAFARATDYATRDLVNKSLLLTVPGDNVFVSCPTPNRIQVYVERTVPLFFARVLGHPTKAIPAVAVAEAYAVGNPLKCVVPWAIPAPWTDNGDGIYQQGEGDFHWPPNDNICTANNYAITHWDYATHDNSTPRSTRDQYMCQGSMQKLKIGDPHDSAIPGNFFGLNLGKLATSCPEGVDIDNGANFYNYMIKHPCECTLNIDLNADIPPIPTEPGMMVGPTLQATGPDEYFGPGGYPGNADSDSLMNRDPGAEWDYSTNMPKSLYYNSDKEPGRRWFDSPRVVRIPVYSPNSEYNGGLNTPPGGSQPFAPLGFVGFWLEDVVYLDKDPITGENKKIGTVVGRFVTVEGISGGNETGEAEGTVWAIRLVK